MLHPGYVLFFPSPELGEGKVCKELIPIIQTTKYLQQANKYIV